MLKTISLFAVAGLLSLAACNDSGKTESTQKMSSTDSSSFDITEARKWVDADNSKFSDEVKRGDSNAVAAHYHSEGQVLLANSEPIMHKDIAGAWGMMSRMGVKELKITTSDLTGCNDLMVETGNYAMTGPNNKELDHGKYVVVWKKEGNSWKIYRDIPVTTMPKQ